MQAHIQARVAYTSPSTSCGVRPRAKGDEVRNYDIEFIKRFLMVIGFLVAVTLILIIASRSINRVIPPATSHSALRQLESRIAPVGAVYAGTTGAAAQAAAQAAAMAAAASQVAYGGTLDGGTIYQNLCTGCHGSGAGGAPTLDHAHWDARIAQGIDTLYRHSLDGFTGSTGMMPAKGGNPALSEEQVHAAVDWMIGNLK